MRLTIDTYFEPNRTIGKLRDLIKSETNIDPLKEFSELAAPNWKHSFRDRVSLESFAHAPDLAPRSVLIGGPTHMSEAMPQLSEARERLPETHQGDPEKRGRNDG